MRNTDKFYVIGTYRALFSFPEWESRTKDLDHLLFY